MKGKLDNDILAAKFGTKNRANHILRTEATRKAITDILWMARRYANERKTYAPSLFNDAYDYLRAEFGNDIDANHATDMQQNKFYDITIETTKEHPYAIYGDDMESQDNRNLVNRPFYKKP